MPVLFCKHNIREQLSELLIDPFLALMKWSCGPPFVLGTVVKKARNESLAPRPFWFSHLCYAPSFVVERFACDVLSKCNDAVYELA